MCLAQTWHIPGVSLPWTSARPAVPLAPAPAAGRERFSRAAVLEPGHRPPAAPPPPPRGQPRRQPQPPATFRLTTAGPQLRHTPAAAVSDLDPDHAACSPGPPPGPSPLQRPSRCAGRCSRTAPQQRGVLPAPMPRPGHPGRERAGHPGPLRPPGHRHALPHRPGHQRTRLPRPAPRPGKPPGTAGGTFGDARPARRPASSPGHAPARPVRGRP
jgi:hypothetical protein